MPNIFCCQMNLFILINYTTGGPSLYSSGKKNLSEISFRLISFRFVHCFIREVSYEISCLMHNHIFMWARELRGSRTKYRLGSCEISYEISFGILQDFVRDIVSYFARFHTRYCLGFCEVSYEI